MFVVVVVCACVRACVCVSPMPKVCQWSVVRDPSSNLILKDVYLKSQLRVKLKSIFI